ncbi:hypothetical protein A2Z33_06115 [Candidatus Gottesmanbacteria bacterium RBG_16_52_11]|uniref:Uncharacterized protein n=1 Tax=Candidatus Gottesmanbacteria bacterium RBG_16_52_11 TaxID=1798374 RepID=A0A1F5YXE2_9BACT|nr:MAG: hypothetical protein A2Z33_06115 [Candidatus Gottesmanbacteria bacterium RBG_16_52_11]
MDLNSLRLIPQSLYTRTASDGQPEKIAPDGPKVRQYPQLSDRTFQEEGKNEQMKNEAAKKEEDKQTIDDLVRKSNRCIISISSLFPWDFFANTIQVEESRVTFIFRQFMASQSHSVDIKDISNIFIESSPFFATLQVVSRTYIQNDIKIGHLNAGKANEVRMIIEGLRTFAAHNIDTSNYEIDELISKIGEFHTNHIVS